MQQIQDIMGKAEKDFDSREQLEKIVGHSLPSGAALKEQFEEYNQSFRSVEPLDVEEPKSTAVDFKKVMAAKLLLERSAI